MWRRTINSQDILTEVLQWFVADTEGTSQLQRESSGSAGKWKAALRRFRVKSARAGVSADRDQSNEQGARNYLRNHPQKIHRQGTGRSGAPSAPSPQHGQPFPVRSTLTA
ncbi:hypothetical protein NDU88_009510 [Pleurodeles waltl]|uniref:Uncharacterized protein n=1 Tax=Pleurodeles waltl TaxID=8319 RepID=A0AAV7S0K7_PLEWA|nr:hypothetical protein NDU88_009510 [Pleurodeles waltl]